MKRNDIHIIYSLLCTLLLSACIKNDIPYPRIKAQILGISADGQIGTAAIDNDKRMVTMELSDTVDLRRVHIETLDLTEGAVSDLPSDSIIDLSKSYTLTLSIYQDYTWTINATQNIERSFRVEGQIGAPVFDAHNHRAIAYVNKDIDLANIKNHRTRFRSSGNNLIFSRKRKTHRFLFGIPKSHYRIPRYYGRMDPIYRTI